MPASIFTISNTASHNILVPSVPEPGLANNQISNMKSPIILTLGIDGF
jgi:hypothetical protein